jgi:hypothetical protein
MAYPAWKKSAWSVGIGYIWIMIECAVSPPHSWGHALMWISMAVALGLAVRFSFAMMDD